MKRNLLLLILSIASLNCKGQSRSELNLEQLIERDKVKLISVTEKEKTKGIIYELHILDLKFGQSTKTVDSILKQKSDFESVNGETKEFENYGINWKLNNDLEIPTIIRTNFYQDKLYELELVVLTDDNNIELGFDKLTGYLRKKYGKEDLKTYSMLSQSKENGPFTYCWIEKNRKVIAYRMQEYCYLRVSDSSVDYDKLTNIFGNKK